MSALPRPDLTGPARTLNDALHDLHHRAGWPSLRTLARETGVSHTTVSKVFSTPSTPAWGTLELVVEALAGDTARFHELWLAATTPGDVERPAPAPRIAGRRAELDAVRRHLETGNGLLLVSGEAGIGKTKLVTTAAATIDTFVATGRCLPLSTEVPVLPFVDILRCIHERDDGQGLKAAIADCPAFVRSTLAPLLPELDTEAAPALAHDDAAGRQRLFVSVASILRSLTAIDRVALLVEDLHWADSGTLDLFAHMLNAASPVAVIGTWREQDPEVSSAHQRWRERVLRTAGVDVLRLGPLNLADTADHLELLTGRPPEGSLVDSVYRRSGGVPLFSEQLISSDAAPDGLPWVLSELLDRRLASLQGDAWVVARALAVADRPLPSDVLADATGLDRSVLGDVLRDLGRNRLARAAEADAVTLRHPLLAEGIRRRLLGPESFTTHRAVAEALARRDGEPGEVARHWAAAADREQELEWRIRAAHRSQSRAAWPLEREEWKRVLELWPEGTVRHQATGTSLAEAYDRAILLAEIASDGKAGLELAHRAVALEVEPSERAALLSRAGEYECAVGDGHRGLEWLNRSIALDEQDPPGVLAQTLVRRGSAMVRFGRFAEAGRDFDLALELVRAAGDPDLLRSTTMKVAWLHGLRGSLDEAMALAREAWAVPRAAPDPFRDLLTVVEHTDLLLRAERPPDELMTIASGPLADADRWDIDRYASAVVRFNLCESLLRAGEVSAAGAVVDPLTGGDVHEATPALHVARAVVDVRRGLLRQALDRMVAVERVVEPGDAEPGRDAGSVNRTEDDHWHAEAEIWAGRPTDAMIRLDGRIRGILATGWALDACRFLPLYARAVADHSDLTSAPPAERSRLAHQLAAAVSTAVHDPFGARAIGRAVPGHAATWGAELQRITGDATVDVWIQAAAFWSSLHRPHDAAYCRWRAAQVALRAGQGTVAARLLKRAAADAREHVPLSRAIAETVVAAP